MQIEDKQRLNQLLRLVELRKQDLADFIILVWGKNDWNLGGFYANDTLINNLYEHAENIINRYV